ncbi:MAG: hypothetical protein ACRC1R_00650 [Cetobacterium sp.]|uniref:hypothetical protein n=1 Tax=Cetobacterium sp. TaxID=2071632 RepID=UPI003F2DD4F7
MNHSFDIDLAKEYGIEAAIILENFAFWIKKNSANNVNFIDGNYWTFNSASALEELFPYMNLKKIQRVLNKLEELNILKSDNHNSKKYDRTKWYCIVDKSILERYKIPTNLDKCSLDKMSNAKDKMSNASTQNVQPIPYVNTDINTDIKNKHVTCVDLKKSEKKIMLGLNPKGYPQKDEWEKFLNKNLVGIDYTPTIEKAIKSLLKTETPVAVEKILLETYKTGLDTGRNTSEIATIISKGNALRAKKTISKKEKTIEVEPKKQEESKVISSLEKEKEFLEKRELERQEAAKQKLPEVEFTRELEKKLIDLAVLKDKIDKEFLANLKIKNNFIYENMLKKYL